MRRNPIFLSAVIALAGCLAWQRLIPAQDNKLQQGETGIPKAGDIRDDNALKLQLVWCPPGTFTMGSPEDEKGRRDNEKQVQVTLTGFWMGRTEATQGQWKALMGTDSWKEHREADSFRKGDEYPAFYVSWDDAAAFCAKLTAQERMEGRLPANEEYALPTEAQWEYACRAGTTTRFSFGDEDSKIGGFAWYGRNSTDAGETYVNPVGQKKANPWGLYDMHGNLWEWCKDGYQERLPGGRDPLSPKGAERVRRGGDWGVSANITRSAVRRSSDPDFQVSNVGFRVARSSVR